MSAIPPEVIATAPPEVQAALGGPPLKPPSPQMARRIQPGRPDAPQPGEAPAQADKSETPVPGRASNPLFDEPALDVRHTRGLFGQAALAAERAIEAHAHLLRASGEALAEASRREGFDLAAAAKVAADFAALLDKHKPRKREQSSKGAEK